MYLKKINSIKILLSSIYILLFFSSCDNDDDNQSQDQSTIEWTQQQNIPAENLRFNAPIVTYNNEAYLLPGKGGSRFSFEPEILKFSSNRWTEIAIYDGFANAGNSGAFINEDLIYIVGGFLLQIILLLMRHYFLVELQVLQVLHLLKLEDM